MESALATANTQTDLPNSMVSSAGVSRCVSLVYSIRDATESVVK
jgi:hypothetical protein